MDWQSKDMRNCLLQFAREQGILNAIWEEYVGHSPKGVTERHYIARIKSVPPQLHKPKETIPLHFAGVLRP